MIPTPIGDGQSKIPKLCKLTRLTILESGIVLLRVAMKKPHPWRDAVVLREEQSGEEVGTDRVGTRSILEGVNAVFKAWIGGVRTDEC